MAGMKFNADIDLEKIVKLRKEIDKLKKSLIEIASVPNSDAAVKALEKQLASALKKLEKYKDKYVQTQQARIDQEKAASEQIKKQQKEIDSLIKKYEALQKQIEKGTGRVSRSPKTYTDDQISVALKTQVQSIKEAREQLKVLRFAQANVTDQQERETGARTKLNIKIQENTRYLKLNSDAYTRQKMEIGNYEENIRRALDGTGQFNLSLSKMLGVIGGTAALKGLVTDMINVRGEFQKTSIAFETMLGSKEKADALMAQMVETAAKTPFDLQGVTSGAKQLLAYGTSADKVNETLVRLGNIASGLSIPLGELVYLYGTSMSQGRLFTQDVNQFMGRGIPLVAELSKELGKTESEIRKMVTEGKVGFPELQKVIENMTNEGGKFYNFMEMQSTTLSGQISNLGDAWDSMLNSIGEDTQGIASMTISAATSIIENYDKVGKIILSIAATYGTYKAALIAVELYERRAAAARLLHIKIIRAQAVAQAALNLVSKANPYVLLATAIVGVTTAMWALHDSTTTTEREMERISKRTEVYNKYLQDEKNHVNELISVLQNENSTKKERIEAFNELQTKYPQYFGKYKTEKELIDHLTESLKGYNEQLRIRQELMNVKNNNDDIKRYKELEKFLSLARKGKDQRTSVEESDFNFYLKKYDVRKRGIGVTVEEYIQEMLASLSATIGEGQEIIRKQEQTAWEVALDSMDKTTAEGHKKMLEGYKILLRESGKEWIKIEGSEAPVNADILTNRIKQLNDKILNVEWKNAETYRKEAKIAWEKAKKEVEDVKSGKATYKSEADYQKALKEKQDAESEAEKRYKNLGGVTGNELSKQEKEAEKRKKEQEKLNEDLLSLRRQNQQAEIDLMKEGTEKKLKQIDLDYQKELDAIKKQEKELSEKQKGKLTSEQSIEISDRYTNAENKRDKAIADVTKEQLKAEQQALNDYLKEYGTFQQQKFAIAQEYAEKIKKVQEESGANSAQVKLLEKQRDVAIQNKETEAIKANIDWVTVFGEFGSMFNDMIKPALEEAKKYVQTDKFKSSDQDSQKALIDAINQMEQSLGGAGGLNFKKLGQDIKAYQLAEQNRLAAIEEETMAHDKLAKAQDDYTKALKNGTEEEKKAAQNAFEIAQQNANAASMNVQAQTSAANEMQQSLTNTATALKVNMENVTSGLQKLASGGIKNVYEGLLQIGKGAGGAMEKFADKLDKVPIVGWIISIIDVFKDGLSNFVGTLLDSVFNAVSGILSDVLSGDLFVTLGKSIRDGVSNIFNAISFGGFDSLINKISGSNAKEVQEAIDRLTDRNETLEKSIDRLTDVMDKSAGSKSISAYEQAYKYQKEQIDNTLKIAREQARYSNSHHSWQYYMEWNDEQLRWVRENVDKNFSGTNSLWGLTPEQMRELLSNADIYEQIKSSGKGGYGERVMEKLEAYADQAGKLDELTEKINESLMQISFDGLRDNFLESLMDMDKDAKSFSEDFSEYMQRALLNFSMGELFDDELREWYNGIAKLMKENGGKLTKQQLEDARKEYDAMVQDAINERDKIAEITGYTGSSSSSQEASKKGFATASQDSIDELNGRFTALQIAGEEIKNQNQLQTMSILELRADMLPIIANTTGIKDIASETRDLLRLSYEELTGIHDDTTSMNKSLKNIETDIAEVKRNTNGLSKR
ncbi:tape measure protein [uncultured Bacteroides sp.]|uniref:tape measure protein n=1 Tax=uncultured Bacteroides sp. TaxID=162156 RepID=UPI00261EC628|nr:tape measure protein [uncultured Bacteroides sp.]